MPHDGSHRNWTSTCCAYARWAYSRPVRPADVVRVAAQHDREAVESHGKKLHALCDTDSGAEDPRDREARPAHQDSTLCEIQMPAL